MHPDLDRHVHKYYGKYMGMVMDNQDADKQGRIKVHVPSIFEQGKAVWARPCLPPGFFFIPAVQTKVWVEFEGGNLSYPIWVGVWYIAQEVPKSAQTSAPVTSVIHTPGGFRIELHDKEGAERILVTRGEQDDGQRIALNFATGKEKIEIQDARNNRVLLDEKGIAIQDKAGNTITMEGSKITVKSTGKVILNDGGAGIVTAGSPTGTHQFCFVTGAPIMASKTCEAGG